MPIQDKKRGTWKGRVRIKGCPQKEKRGFKTKEKAIEWENEIKAIFRAQGLTTYGAGTAGEDFYLHYKEKYHKFITVSTNTIPVLIDIMLEDFKLPYSFEDLKRIVKKSKSTKTPANIRLQILKRDDYRCVLCGATSKDDKLHVDHIVPIDRGGITEERNLRVLCRKCNLGKKNLPFHVTG